MIKLKTEIKIFSIIQKNRLKTEAVPDFTSTILFFNDLRYCVRIVNSYQIYAGY